MCGFLMVIMNVMGPMTSHSQPLAKGRDKFLGCATSSYIWPNLHLYWNQVTPGNDGKWESVEGIQGQYGFTNLDNIYNYTMQKGIPFKEHTLVWGNQQPSWISTLDSSQQRAAVEEWIRQVGQRYPGMSFVDVVNEPFHAPPSYKGALGGDGTTGWDWVITAFQLARQHCSPWVKLLLNEYNVLQDYTVTTNYINLITLLKDRGLIDGIGIQGHYFEFRSHVHATSNVYIYDTNTLKGNLDRLTAIGLPIYITEFDIDEADDADQLAQYQIYFPLFWTHPGVKGMTLWGYIQNDVWTAHPDTYVLRYDGSERPVIPWLRSFIATPFPPVLVSPVSTSGVPRNPRLTWRSSESALSYRVQVSTTFNMSTTVLDSSSADTTFQVGLLAANTRHYWRVSASNDSGTSAYTTTAWFITGDQVVAVEQSPAIPGGFVLSQGYPNPFNASTTIGYEIPKHAQVNIAVYDIHGRALATLVGEYQVAGGYSVVWDASQISSGVYFCRMDALTTDGSRGFTGVKKLIVMK